MASHVLARVGSANDTFSDEEIERMAARLHAHESGVDDLVDLVEDVVVHGLHNLPKGVLALAAPPGAQVDAGADLAGLGVSGVADRHARRNDLVGCVPVLLGVRVEDVAHGSSSFSMILPAASDAAGVAGTL